MKHPRKLHSRIFLLSLALCLSWLPVRAQSQATALAQEQQPKPKAEVSVKSSTDAKSKDLPDAPAKGEPCAKPLPATNPQNPPAGQLEFLTPTEGVDYSNYLARVVAGMRRNWFAILPESVRRGAKGRMVLQFRILRNGSVPDGDPRIVTTSGQPSLDRAAMSSIRASSPFEQLPSAFSGPSIELRYTFLYNLPPEAPK